ncbi:MAG: 50S ribosomal protein L19 [Acidobacteria bacterium]|nr:50S ribosomal protein L19 [Acidobacteriota bacterium]
MDIIKQFEEKMLRTDIPDFKAGDTVQVHVKVKEGNKQRIQVYQGLVISRSNGSNRETFTVRKIAEGVGVERIFPLHSPIIDKIKVLRKGRVRRGKLYYIREKIGKAARIREKRSY